VTEPESFIVRFLGPDDNETAGLGTLVDPKNVVTCAHVVNTALGLDQYEQKQSANPVRIVFPLLRGDASQKILTARVAVWRPPPPEPDAVGEDVAGLIIEDRSLPDGAFPAQLAAYHPRPGSKGRVYGYPSKRPDGSWVSVTVRGRVANGWLHLDSTPDSALRVQPGFSGTPVIEDSTGRVVGIIAESGTSSNDSYAIGADVLQKVWPQVGPRPTGRRKRLILLAGAAVAVAAVLSYLIVKTMQRPAQPSARISAIASTTTTIAVGGFPDAVAVDPAAHTAYVTTWDNNSVSVINTITNTVTATVPVGGWPVAVAVDPAAHTAYTATANDNSVSVINTLTNTVTGTISVGKVPDAVAVDPASHTAYVADYGGDSVSVINTATNAATVTAKATIAVGKGPDAVAVDPTSHTAYVANSGDESVSVINTATNTVTATVLVGMDPYAVAVDPAARTAYVTNVGGDSVLVINTATNTVTATITVGIGPDAVAVDPATHTAYVTNSGDNSESVSVINTATNTVTATIPVHRDPHDVTVDSATHTAYVTNSDDNSVSVIKTG